MAKPGFQGSETSWASVVVHSTGTDSVLLSSHAGEYPQDGRMFGDPTPALVGVQTVSSMDNGGTFSFTVKSSQKTMLLFEEIIDDDWVDIIFYRHSKPWHVMRGLIDDSFRDISVSGSGATTEAYTFTGRSFQKVWEVTPVWFSPYGNNDVVTNAIATQVMQGLPTVVGSPPVAVQRYLESFLESIQTNVGPKWAMPDSMKGVVQNNFLQSITFAIDGYQNIPPRKAFNPNYMSQASLWQLAKQYSDPPFCEMYCDLLPDGNPLSPKLTTGEPLPVGSQKMTVVVRDRPFPVEDSIPLGQGYSDQWSEIPVVEVPRQQIVRHGVGRTGVERFNAFFVANMIPQDVMGDAALTVIKPLMNTEDVGSHGMRRFDVQSHQAPDEFDFGVMSEIQRHIAKDWYCLNPYMLSGTIDLAIGRPDIKIGCRVLIPEGSTVFQVPETYYVEQVTNSWRFGPGLRTSLGVTRGWLGDDDDYRAKLLEIGGKYITPSKAS